MAQQQQLRWQGIPSRKKGGDEPWQVLQRRLPPHFLTALDQRAAQLSAEYGFTIPPQALLMTYALESDRPLRLLSEKYEAEQESSAPSGAPRR